MDQSTFNSYLPVRNPVGVAPDGRAEAGQTLGVSVKCRKTENHRRVNACDTKVLDSCAAGDDRCGDSVRTDDGAADRFTVLQNSESLRNRTILVSSMSVVTLPEILNRQFLHTLAHQRLRREVCGSQSVATRSPASRHLLITLS